MSKADPINVSHPAGGSNPRLGDDYIRALARALIELHGVDHYVGTATDNAYSEDDAGKHKKATFRENQSAKPTLGASDTGVLYTKAGELYFEDAAGNEIQLTIGGKVRFASLGDMVNDTYLKGVDEAGTGTVDLIKAGRNEADDADVAVLSDAVRTATNAAPAEATGVANKKYVDDQIVASMFGTREAISKNASKGIDARTAETDGFFIGVIRQVYEADRGGQIYGYVGSSIVGCASTFSARSGPTTYVLANSFCIPVKAGETYSATYAVGNAAAASEVVDFYWMPKGN